MQLLVVDVHAAELRLYALACARLECLVRIRGGHGITQAGNAGLGNVRRELVWWLVDTAAEAKIVSLATPVRWNRHCIAIALEMYEQLRIVRRDIDPLDDLGLADALLELGNRHALRKTALLARHGLLLFLGLRLGHDIVV